MKNINLNMILGCVLASVLFWACAEANTAGVTQDDNTMAENISSSDVELSSSSGVINSSSSRYYPPLGCKARPVNPVAKTTEDDRLLLMGYREQSAYDKLAEERVKVLRAAGLDSAVAADSAVKELLVALRLDHFTEGPDEQFMYALMIDTSTYYGWDERVERIQKRTMLDLADDGKLDSLEICWFFAENFSWRLNDAAFRMSGCISNPGKPNGSEPVIAHLRALCDGLPACTDDLEGTVVTAGNDRYFMKEVEYTCRNQKWDYTMEIDTLEKTQLGLPKGYVVNPKVEYGSVEDPRDGQVYKTVEFGGKTWMAENLNFGGALVFYENGGMDSVVIDPDEFGLCGPDSCTTEGRYYNYNYANLLCPEGWHGPGDEELALFGESPRDYRAFFAIIADDGDPRSGTDEYGLGLRPSGYMDCSVGNECKLKHAFIEYLGMEFRTPFDLSSGPSQDGYLPIRCVKD